MFSELAVKKPVSQILNLSERRLIDERHSVS